MYIRNIYISMLACHNIKTYNIPCIKYNMICILFTLSGLSWPEPKMHCAVGSQLRIYKMRKLSISTLIHIGTLQSYKFSFSKWLQPIPGLMNRKVHLKLFFFIFKHLKRIFHRLFQLKGGTRENFKGMWIGKLFMED